jgi:hypothetical protein
MRLLFAALIALVPIVAMAQQGSYTPFRPQILGQGHPSSPRYGGAHRSYYRPYFRGRYVAPRGYRGGGTFGGRYNYPGGMTAFARDLDQAQWLTGTGPYKLKFDPVPITPMPSVGPLPSVSQ